MGKFSSEVLARDINSDVATPSMRCLREGMGRSRRGGAQLISFRYACIGKTR
jgi:hypothetical protein